ncbi:SEL1-like repeat protein [Pseudomonas sp. 18175]|uniref:SEL1-like repeat protein n=1 Tax=Pseudomonas sp. 18175 TaxID=3390056 RepID=UPI003D1A4C4C
MRWTILLSSLLCVCVTGSAVGFQTKENALNPLTKIKAKLAFSCTHEDIPKPSTDLDELFQYARWLQKNNLLKQDKTIDLEIERLYRIAAENGHYKANINLQNGTMRGQFSLRGEEHLRFSQLLIDAGIATGYYFIGIFLKNGSAGLKQDREMSLRYFRKAADLGNAPAQAYVADILAPRDIAPLVARQMRSCAAEQGHGKAAVILSIYLQDEEKYGEAMEVLQMGVMAGDENAAGRLGKAFRGPLPSNELYYLGQQEDRERADRYEKIWRTLANYSYADPKVPEINEILPLPPAKLPAWDGKLQWLEARLANVPPEKPIEELIHQLAKAKHLEPATGRPTPDSPAFIKVGFPAPTCSSGQPCPQTGYWRAVRLHRAPDLTIENAVIRRFEEKEIMPTLMIEHHKPRFLRPDRITVNEESIEWRLLG